MHVTRLDHATTLIQPTTPIQTTTSTRQGHVEISEFRKITED